MLKTIFFLLIIFYHLDSVEFHPLGMILHVQCSSSKQASGISQWMYQIFVWLIICCFCWIHIKLNLNKKAQPRREKGRTKKKTPKSPQKKTTLKAKTHKQTPQRNIKDLPKAGGGSNPCFKPFIVHVKQIK